MTTASDDLVIQQALSILAGRIRAPGMAITQSADAHRFLVLKLAEEQREVFALLLLDAQHRVIEYRELFYGTIDSASVHPREVVKAALFANAAAMIVAHNHPSGSTEPSRADIAITDRLTRALELIDVRLLDHIIVGGVNTTSLQERGLL